MRYAMIIEQGERNYSTYLPDLPGCIATGTTLDEVRQNMAEAIERHLEGMREDGLPIPEPTSLGLRGGGLARRRHITNRTGGKPGNGSWSRGGKPSGKGLVNHPIFSSKWVRRAKV